MATHFSNSSTSSRPLRILMATPRCFPYMGGVENHVYQVSRRLAKLGAQVTVVSMDNGGQLPAHEQADGVMLRRLRFYPTNSDLYFSPELYRFIQSNSEQWDVLHVQNYLSLVAPVAMLAAARAKIPYVVTFHGGGHSSGFRNAIRGVQQQANRPLLRRAKKLIATARFEINAFGKTLGAPKEQFAYIPNGCDIGTPSAGLQTQPNFIVSVGRVEQYKGHQRVVAAMPFVLRQIPTAKLRVLGDGPYKAELQQQVQQLGLQDAVEIRGVPAAQRQDMADTLARASLVTMMSEYETQPMAALEAIALGRQLLVANTSGLSELAEDGYARAVPLNTNPEPLAETMLDMLRNPQLSKDIRLPTWDDCTESLLKLYHEVAF